MRTITVITRDPTAIDAYLGFGFREVERGRSKFDDHVVILEGPSEHSEWQSCRLCSGNHGARIVDDMSAWAREWGYVADDRTACETGPETMQYHARRNGM